MPGTAVTKSVVANEPGGRKREEIFVDIIEKISVTFSSSVSISCYSLVLQLFFCVIFNSVKLIRKFIWMFLMYLMRCC